MIIIVIQFMFLGINMFRALLRAHFNNPCLTTRAKMSLSRAQNIFLPANICSIVDTYILMVYTEVAFTKMKLKKTCLLHVSGDTARL